MNRTLTDKNEIVAPVKLYLKENSIIDLTSFIAENCPDTHTHSAFVRDIANQMRRTKGFEIEEQQGYADRYLLFPLPKKPFRERNWFLIAIGTYILGLLTSVAQKMIEN